MHEVIWLALVGKVGLR